MGIKVSEVRIVPDIESKIVKNVLSLSKKNNYVLTTGGIGPTHDDITAKSISKAFKKKYTKHKEANIIILKYYGTIKFIHQRKKIQVLPLNKKFDYLTDSYIHLSILSREDSQPKTLLTWVMSICRLSKSF